MAQRLVRVICEHCKEEYEPTPAVVKKWRLADKKGLRLYRAKGANSVKAQDFVEGQGCMSYWFATTNYGK